MFKNWAAVNKEYSTRPLSLCCIHDLTHKQTPYNERLSVACDYLNGGHNGHLQNLVQTRPKYSLSNKNQKRLPICQLSDFLSFKWKLMTKPPYLLEIKWLSQKIPSLRAFPQDSSLNLLPIYYLRIEPWYALKLLRIDQTGSAHQYWPTIDWKISYSTVQAAFPTPYTGRTGTPLSGLFHFLPPSMVEIVIESEI